jgi:hypothetical protein
VELNAALENMQKRLDPACLFMGPNALLAAPPRVINIGLEMFATNIASQGGQVIHVRWSPPAGGNSHLAGILGRLQS